MHRNFRHIPKNGLIQILRADKAPKEYIDAAKSFRCNTGVNEKPMPFTHKVGRPKPYIFNRAVGVDVLDVKDAIGHTFEILNIVCMGTTRQQGDLVREGDRQGSPFITCMLKSFCQNLDLALWMA